MFIAIESGMFISIVRNIKYELEKLKQIANVANQNNGENTLLLNIQKSNGGYEKMSSKIIIPTANDLNEISKEGLKKFEQTVLESSLCKEVIRGIEDAALDGHLEWQLNMESTIDKRALKVIQKALCEQGFECEYEMGLFNRGFVVKWGESKTDKGGSK